MKRYFRNMLIIAGLPRPEDSNTALDISEINRSEARKKGKILVSLKFAK